MRSAVLHIKKIPKKRKKSMNDSLQIRQNEIYERVINFNKIPINLYLPLSELLLGLVGFNYIVYI